MSAANLKQHIDLYFNLDGLLVLTRPIPALLPFSPLSTPANTLVSLHLQLMNAIAFSAEMSQLGFALFPFF
jgi:hypothetical protein